MKHPISRDVQPAGEQGPDHRVFESVAKLPGGRITRLVDGTDPVEMRQVMPPMPGLMFMSD